MFLSVASAEMQGIAKRFGATAHDIDDLFRSDWNDLCTFDVPLSAFGLSIPALGRP